MGRKALDILLCQHVGHCGHLWALARARLIIMQHLLQIVDTLAGQHWQARIGAVAVEAVATVATLGPFRGRQRLAHVRRLRFLRRVVSR